MDTYKVNTGRELTLEDEVARLKELLIEREDKWDEAKTNMALMTDEIAELEKSYKNECYVTQWYKKAWREQRELVALRDDQITMLKRQINLSK